MKFYARNTIHGLVPLYDSDLEIKYKLKLDQDYLVEVKVPRNLKFHKKFWALLNMVYSNQEKYKHMEDMREDLIIEAGFFTTRINLDGQKIKKANSISFVEMDEHNFQELYERVKDVICLHFRFTNQSIEENIHSYY